MKTIRIDYNNIMMKEWNGANVYGIPWKQSRFGLVSFSKWQHQAMKKTARHLIETVLKWEVRTYCNSISFYSIPVVTVVQAYFPLRTIFFDLFIWVIFLLLWIIFMKCNVMRTLISTNNKQSNTVWAGV